MAPPPPPQQQQQQRGSGLEEGLLAAVADAPLTPTAEDERRHGYVPPPRKQGWHHAAFILVAELVGTGVLALPHTFAVIGAPAGLALLVVFALFSLYSGFLLHRLQQWFPAGITYGDMAREVVGPTGQKIVFAFIYVAFFGNLAIYILTCAESLQNVFYDHPTWCKWPFTLATCLFLLPFCQLRTLHHVSYVASASAAAIIVALVIVLAVAFTDDREIAPLADLPADLGAAEQLSPLIHFFKTMSAVTTGIFAFGGQGLYFETMAEMRKPEQFPRAVTLTTGLILVIYIVVALACFSVYGTSVRGNILFALPDQFSKRVAAALLFFHVCISYVLAQQVIGRAIHVRVSHDVVDSGSSREKRQWLAISSALLVLSFLIANGIPFFSSLMGFVGALSTAPLTFGIPAFLVYKASTFLPPLPDRQKRIAPYEYGALVTFGVLTVFLTLVGCASNISELVRNWGDVGPPFACHAGHHN